jgi:hypothetical protein
VTQRHFKVAELNFSFSLADDGLGAPAGRVAHGWLAWPNPMGASLKLNAVVALNGHAGSAWLMMTKHGGQSYWYGDSFACHDWVVLALDVGHRPPADRGVPPLHGHGADDPAHGNDFHPAVGGIETPWAEDGERIWDAQRALDLLLGGKAPVPIAVDGDTDGKNILQTIQERIKNVIVTGHSMGGEVTLMSGGMDDRFAVSVPSGFGQDLGKNFPLGKTLIPPGANSCTQWTRANMTEYIDTADFMALTAPRPLVFMTGMGDGTASNSAPAVMAPKQQAWRGRAAYDPNFDKFVHYLQERGHIYRVGDKALTSAITLKQHIQVPDKPEPSTVGDTSWQSDTAVSQVANNLYDLLKTWV